MFCVPTHFETTVEKSVAKKIQYLFVLLDRLRPNMLSVPIHQGNQIRTTMQSEEPDVSESIKEEYMCFAFF